MGQYSEVICYKVVELLTIDLILYTNEPAHCFKSTVFDTLIFI